MAKKILSSDQAKDWKYLQFSVPISKKSSAEEGEESKDFLIQGTAINSTITRNGVEFVSEELKSSAASLRNKPLLKDHINSVDSIVGRTTNNVSFDESSGSIVFEGRVVDKDTQEKINNGLITNVSVGAMVDDLEEAKNDDGEVTHMVLRGVEFVELSFVAVPADPKAGLAQAVKASFDLKNKAQKNKIQEKMDPKEENQNSSMDEIKSLLSDMGTKVNEGFVSLNKRMDKIEQDAEPAEETPAEETPKETPKEEPTAPAEG